MSVAGLPPHPPAPAARIIGPPPGWTPPPPQAPAPGPTLAPAPPAPPLTGPSSAPPPPGPTLSPPVPLHVGPPLSDPVPVQATIPDDTQGEVEAEETRMVSRSRHIVILHWDDGTQTRVNVPTRIGRNPASSDNERSVAIADTTSSLSKTHARLDVTDNGPTIEDMHSTNGVQVQRGGQKFPVATGTPTELHPGDILIFGLRTATVMVTP